ncbi:MAG TPA: type I methionyl aminopeptidase [Candidatus Paceibacterota bacterium]|nr:type I methionyl aminopeptidase [Candidatus Paceibacterota bacterium]
MSLIKTPAQIEAMKEGGRILAAILSDLADYVKPGMTTRELSARTVELLRSHQVQPSFLDYNNYPDVICLSVNHQCVHTPGSDYVLKEGDLLKLDFGVIHKGLHTDAARTVLVTNLSRDEAREKKEYHNRRKLMQVTRECLEKAIVMCRPDGYLGDIGHVIESHVKDNGFSIAAELGGHGIGTKLHEEPWVANTGKPQSGMKLEAGMVLAIEPIINMGRGAIKDGDDGFTYETADGSLSAHFEHTVVITEGGPVILTA